MAWLIWTIEVILPLYAVVGTPDGEQPKTDASRRLYEVSTFWRSDAEAIAPLVLAAVNANPEAWDVGIPGVKRVK